MVMVRDMVIRAHAPVRPPNKRRRSTRPKSHGTELGPWHAEGDIRLSEWLARDVNKSWTKRRRSMATRLLHSVPECRIPERILLNTILLDDHIWEPSPSRHPPNPPCTIHSVYVLLHLGLGSRLPTTNVMAA